MIIIRNRTRILVYILAMLIFLSYAAPVVLAANDTGGLPSTPSFKAGWGALGSTAQERIVLLLNILFAVVVIIATGYTFYGGLNYFIGGRQHDAVKRNSGFEQIAKGILVVFACVIGYSIIVSQFTT